MKFSPKSFRYDNVPAIKKQHEINVDKNISAILLIIILCGVALMTALACVINFFPTTAALSKSLLVDRNPKTVSTCNIQIVETIPIGLNYTLNSPKFLSTFDAWNMLLDNAAEEIDIASFYWTLRKDDVINHTSAQQGEEIFKRLLANANAAKKLKIRIAQSESTDLKQNLDTQLLTNFSAAEVVSLNLPKYFGGGVLHTKLWIVDNKHFYIGSANMDWRSLTQVKELGVLGINCSGLAQDIKKIFEEYWFLGSKPDEIIPEPWPNEYSTKFNVSTPMVVNYNQQYTMATFFSSSPPPFSASGRTHDLDAIINAIDSATTFVNIAVMDYYPLIIYASKTSYWPYIDDAIRRAAIERKIRIKMLISWWQHSRPSEDYFLRSLQVISNSQNGIDLQIRRFVVPVYDDQAIIPYARVNHNKYMVTDNIVYIGTSNWSGDYFTTTAGIGYVLKETEPNSTHSLRNDLLNVFERDWNSPYAKRFIIEN